MSGDGSEFEYPDTAGYPDGMGTLHEGTDDMADESADDAATEAEGDLEAFALDDEEDVEGV
ncbi:hypothetical protein [Agromyces cerinus]|uniref:Uncharacterized protein n=1 Tax=Agromyces cerinus subsp. cerinus TaxID=232089 RepID=A0A1N6HDT3_9MICO|nr:hypothetical protein [Agromyces cerinus]SIO17867.1 hypothetical protein SAMN05443544_3096 [Agromyces cerinus subsp. cerinus]